jgi:hypothetical protein
MNSVLMRILPACLYYYEWQNLAGLHYGYKAISQEWRAVIKRRDWIEEMVGNFWFKRENERCLERSSI